MRGERRLVIPARGFLDSSLRWRDPNPLEEGEGTKALPLLHWREKVGMRGNPPEGAHEGRTYYIYKARL